MGTIHSERVAQALSALDADPRTQDSVVKVLDDNGILTLRGRATSEEARAAAEEIVAAQEGVIRVLNELQVGGVDSSHVPPQPVPPEEHPYIDG